MPLEDIYSDLERIAKNVGPLDKDAVRGATSILAQPRYAASLDPAALLLEDLKRVIAAIPNYPIPKSAADVEWSSYNFRSYARRYFSLDAAGQGFIHRRNFGRKDPGGSAGAWMTRGVLYRVAAGLFELWSGADTGDSGLECGYRIDRVRASKVLKPDFLGFRYHATHVLEYDLSLVVSGPHILPIPLPPRSTRLELSTERAHDTPDEAQLASFGSRPLPFQLIRGRQAAVVFGSQLRPGGRVCIRLSRKIHALAPEARTGVWYWVNEPVAKLELAVDFDEEDDYSWHVQHTGPDTQDVVVPSSRWTCENPAAGLHVLRGVQLTRAERRQKQIEAAESD